jgi:hypothetical protein
MKLVKINNTNELKEQFNNKELFISFKNQIIKDFILSGIDLNNNFIHLNSNDLIIYLTEEITYLIDHKFESFLKLLYRIDIPENIISQKINHNTNNSIYKELTFLILKRVWLKIWYKSNY